MVYVRGGEPGWELEGVIVDVRVVRRTIRKGINIAGELGREAAWWHEGDKVHKQFILIPLTEDDRVSLGARDQNIISLLIE